MVGEYKGNITQGAEVSLHRPKSEKGRALCGPFSISIQVWQIWEINPQIPEKYLSFAISDLEGFSTTRGLDSFPQVRWERVNRMQTGGWRSAGSANGY